MAVSTNQQACFGTRWHLHQIRPRASRLVTLVSCWLFSLFHHCLQPGQCAVCSVPTEQQSRVVQRTMQQRAVQSSRAGVDSVSGFASGPCHALLCYAMLYFMLWIGWMVYDTIPCKSIGWLPSPVPTSSQPLSPPIHHMFETLEMLINN